MNWDIYTKLLLKECPQDFVTYFTPGARFVCLREAQLQTREDGPFEAREMRGDVLIEAEYESQPFLIDVEWQAKKDAKMDERLLGYSYEATRLHDLSVLPCVIYVKKVSGPPQPPLKRGLPTGRKLIWFDFDSCELAGTSVEEFRQLNLDAFLPLMLLCQGGATYDVLEEVLTLLQGKGRMNLLALTRAFAGLVFRSEDDHKHIERRFSVLDDILREHSWTYRATLDEGRVEGRVEGLEQGLAQGLLAMRQSIEALVQVRFPALLDLVKSRIAQQKDLAKLQEFLIIVGTVRTADEVERSLLAFN